MPEELATAETSEIIPCCKTFLQVLLVPGPRMASAVARTSAGSKGR